MRWMDPNFDETRRQGRVLYRELKAWHLPGAATDAAAIKDQFQELHQNEEKWSGYVDITNFF